MFILRQKSQEWKTLPWVTAQAKVAIRKITQARVPVGELSCLRMENKGKSTSVWPESSLLFKPSPEPPVHLSKHLLKISLSLQITVWKCNRLFCTVFCDILCFMCLFPLGLVVVEIRLLLLRTVFFSRELHSVQSSSLQLCLCNWISLASWVCVTPTIRHYICCYGRLFLPKLWCVEYRCTFTLLPCAS